jgi:hypothetical protein
MGRAPSPVGASRQAVEEVGWEGGFGKRSRKKRKRMGRLELGERGNIRVS